MSPYKPNRKAGESVRDTRLGRFERWKGLDLLLVRRARNKARSQGTIAVSRSWKGSWPPAIDQQENRDLPWLYGHKKVNSANNLHKPGSAFSRSTSKEHSPADTLTLSFWDQLMSMLFQASKFGVICYGNIMQLIIMFGEFAENALTYWPFKSYFH